MLCSEQEQVHPKINLSISYVPRRLVDNITGVRNGSEMIIPGIDATVELSKED